MPIQRVKERPLSRLEIQQNIQGEYGAFLNAMVAPDSWDLFFTATGREDWSTKVWRSKLNWMLRRPRASYERSDSMVADQFFWGLELHRYFDRIHAHGLIKLREPIHNMKPKDQALMASWYWEDLFKYFGRSQVDIFDPTKAAVHYVTKYCLKQSLFKELDYDFFQRS